MTRLGNSPRGPPEVVGFRHVQRQESRAHLFVNKSGLERALTRSRPIATMELPIMTDNHSTRRQPKELHTDDDAAQEAARRERLDNVLAILFGLASFESRYE